MIVLNKNWDTDELSTGQLDTGHLPYESKKIPQYILDLNFQAVNDNQLTSDFENYCRFVTVETADNMYYAIRARIEQHYLSGNLSKISSETISSAYYYSKFRYLENTNNSDWIKELFRNGEIATSISNLGTNSRIQEILIDVYNVSRGIFIKRRETVNVNILDELNSKPIMSGFKNQLRVAIQRFNAGDKSYNEYIQTAKDILLHFNDGEYKDLGNRILLSIEQSINAIEA